MLILFLWNLFRDVKSFFLVKICLYNTFSSLAVTIFEQEKLIKTSEDEFPHRILDFSIAVVRYCRSTTLPLHCAETIFFSHIPAWPKVLSANSKNAKKKMPNTLAKSYTIVKICHY